MQQNQIPPLLRLPQITCTTRFRPEKKQRFIMPQAAV